MGERRMLTVAAGLALLVGCGGSSAPENVTSATPVMRPDADFAEEVEGKEARRAPGANKPRRLSRPKSGAKVEQAMGSVASAPPMDPEVEDVELAAEPEKARVRSWFPDSFVWEPVVVTDENGRASVPVKVPDTLTDWRVLGLAHDRTGQQAGAVTGFASRLPVSADPRLPSYLYVGDQLAMPVRASNGTDSAMNARIEVLTEGALTGGGTATLALGARGVGVRPVNLTAARQGMATVRTAVAGGGHVDRSERTLRVTPIGRPIEALRRGTLAAETPLSLPELDGVVGEEEVDVVVFPGPMALVQAEVDRFAAGARPALAGSALAAVDHLLTLSAKTGAAVDDKTLRRLKLLAWQQVSREVRNADWQKAVGLLRAASGRDLVGAVESARPGLIRTVQQAQRPDGTWSSASRSTLQLVLVQTATAARVLPEGAARLKAEGALERQLPNIDDPYTAAVLVGSGVLKGSAADPARTLITEALVRDEAGVPGVVVPDDVLDAWGQRPSRTAMLAWTVLALADDDAVAEDRGMLAAELIGSWSAGRGFGAGRADPVALEAVVKAVPGASGATTVSLWSGDDEVARGVVDPTQPGVPLLLSTSDPSAVVKLDPPVSGLAYTATRRGYAPWPTAASIDGFDWEWTASGLEVGEASTVELNVSVPRGTRLTVEVGLPAGMEVDAKALAAHPKVAWSEVLEDRVRFGTQALDGVATKLPLSVTPSFAGTFHSSPLKLAIPGQGDLTLPGRVWTVR